MLLLLEVAALAALVVVGAALLEGSRAELVFLGIVGFLAAWGGQAIGAYREAVARGARPGGAIAILALAPVAAGALTGFWLLAGTAGSPSALLERYVSAWREGRTEQASTLFLDPAHASALAERWSLEEAYIRARLAALAARYGPTGGLDPAQPFANLTFVSVGPADPGGGRLPARPAVSVARFEVRLFRRVPVRGTFFGFPTASQRSETLEQVGTATLRSVVVPPPLGIGPPSPVWRIESFSIGGPTTAGGEPPEGAGGTPRSHVTHARKI